MSIMTQASVAVFCSMVNEDAPKLAWKQVRVSRAQADDGEFVTASAFYKNADQMFAAEETAEIRGLVVRRKADNRAVFVTDRAEAEQAFRLLDLLPGLPAGQWEMLSRPQGDLWAYDAVEGETPFSGYAFFGVTGGERTYLTVGYMPNREELSAAMAAAGVVFGEFTAEPAPQPDLAAMSALARAAWRLANAFGHEWAALDDQRISALVEESGGNPARFNHLVDAALDESAADADMGRWAGVTPTLSWDAQGNLQSTHETATGRTRWVQTARGITQGDYTRHEVTTVATISRPSGDVLKAAVNPCATFLERVSIEALGGYGLRHLDAVRQVVTALTSGYQAFYAVAPLVPAALAFDATEAATKAAAAATETETA